MTTRPALSSFARSLTAETAFDVLAVARRLKAAGKDVIELQIGDSPFPSTASAIRAGKAAIDAGQTRYAPSLGLPEFRATIAATVKAEFGIPATADNVVVAPGAKPFEQFFCEAFLNPGDGVLIFSPHFPTYPPNVHRRGARCVFAPLSQSRGFRPDPAAVERFLADDPSPKAVFLNSPHNPTGGAATEEDLAAIADLVFVMWKEHLFPHEVLLLEVGSWALPMAAYNLALFLPLALLASLVADAGLRRWQPARSRTAAASPRRCASRATPSTSRRTCSTRRRSPASRARSRASTSSSSRCSTSAAFSLRV